MNCNLCCFFYARLGNVGSSPRSSDLVKLAQECCYHSNRGIAAHGVRVLTNITVSCQEKGKCAQPGQGSVGVVVSVIFSLCALMCSCIHLQRSKASVLGQPDPCEHLRLQCGVGISAWALPISFLCLLWCVVLGTGIARIRFTYTASGKVLGLSRWQVLSLSGG